MEWTERIVPDETEKGIVSIHLKRYEFARGKCLGKRVLDLGCGTGYGSAYLAEKASRVTAVDHDSETIQYALRRYPSKNIEYLLADAERLPFKNESFEIICCFEAIEHFKYPDQCLNQVKKILKKNGLLFLSTPLAINSDSHSGNPHHYQEWSHSEFLRLAERYFSQVQIWWQVRKQTKGHRLFQKMDVFGWRRRIPAPLARMVARFTGTVPFRDLDLEDIEIKKDFSSAALSQLAICQDPILE